MLKGKTKVELFDAETGELVKSVEKHNEITSAYQRLINHMFFLGTTYKNVYLTDAFGSIIMFDSDVPDGAIVQDKTNHCTGMAFYNQSENTVNKVGSYNKLESSIDYDKKIATFVYDFTTSQANGTVKSICLCSKGITMINGLYSGGINSDYNISDINKYFILPYDDPSLYIYHGTGEDWRRDDSLQKPLSNYGPSYYYLYGTNYDVFFDFENGIRYAIKFKTNKKFYALKQVMAENKWSAFINTSSDNWQANQRNIRKEESIEVDLSSIYGGFDVKSSNQIKCIITGYKGMMYIMPVVSSTQSGGTNLSILKYNFNNFGIEENEASFFSVLIPTGYSMKANYSAGFYVDSEYVYFVVTNDSKYYVAKASMTNNADSKILQQIDVNSFNDSRCGWMPGTFYYNIDQNNTKGFYFINLDDGSVSTFSNSSNSLIYYVFQKYVPDFKTDYMYLCSSSNYYSYNYCYYDYTLKSINNLTDPIVKTNTNIMKITYTLTETDS